MSCPLGTRLSPLRNAPGRPGSAILLQGHCKCCPKDASSSDIGHCAGPAWMAPPVPPPAATICQAGPPKLLQEPRKLLGTRLYPHSSLSLCHLSPVPPPPSETACGADLRSCHFTKSRCAKGTGVRTQLLSAQSILDMLIFVLFSGLMFFNSYIYKWFIPQQGHESHRTTCRSQFFPSTPG